jgi:hypothetical protein
MIKIIVQKIKNLKKMEKSEKFWGEAPGKKALLELSLGRELKIAY